MNVLVCGGRYYDNFDKVCLLLNEIYEFNPDVTVVHGACHIDFLKFQKNVIVYKPKIGADYFADIWCSKQLVFQKRYPANWNLFGRFAGPKRNKQMVTENIIDLCLAFPGGSGTRNMINLCRKKGIDIVES